MKNKKQFGWMILIITLIIFILGGYAYYAVSNSDTIYYWDASYYWAWTIKVKNLFEVDILSAFREVYQSIIKLDYSYVPSLFLVIPLRLFGISRLVYVESIMFFAVVFEVVFLLLVYRCDRESISSVFNNLNSALKINFVFICVLGLNINNVLTAPILEGLPDAVGLVFIGFILHISYTILYKKLSKTRIILLAVQTALLLCLLPITRRWYVFWILGLGCSVFLIGTIKLFQRKIFIEKQYFSFWILSGIISLFIMFTFFKDFIIRNVTVNYSKIYIAYNTNLGNKLISIINQFGIITLVLCAIGLFCTLKTKKIACFSFLVFSTSVIAVSLFMQVQNFSPQHFYLLLPGVMFFACFGILAMIKFCFLNHKLVCTMLFLLLSLNFVNNNFVNDNKNCMKLMGVKNSPTVFKMKKKFEDMIQDILTNRIDEDNMIYLVAASDDINSSKIQSIDLPEKFNDYKNFYHTHDVDERDGFSWDALKAQYILIFNPAQDQHLPGHQEIIGVFNDMILQGEAKESVSLIKEYKLSESVTGYLFKKNKNYSKEFVNNLIKRIKISNPKAIITDDPNI